MSRDLSVISMLRGYLCVLQQGKLFCHTHFVTSLDETFCVLILEDLLTSGNNFYLKILFASVPFPKMWPAHEPKWDIISNN